MRRTYDISPEEKKIRITFQIPVSREKELKEKFYHLLYKDEPYYTYILDHHTDTTVKEMAKALGWNPRSVKSFLNLLGLNCLPDT